MKKCIAKIIVLWVMIFLSPVLFAAELNPSIQKIAKELSAQMKARQAKKLAVVNFSDLNGYQSTLGDLIAEELVTALFQEGGFDVVERRELSRILGEQAKYTSNVFDKKTVAQLQKLLGIDVLVTGTIANLGTHQIRVNSRAISVETGKVLAAAAASIDRDQNIDNLMQQSSNSNSGTLMGAKQGSLQQPSNAYFKNKILHVIPTGVVKLDDKKGFRITTQFRNLTNEPLSIANHATDDNYPSAFASTELGDLFRLKISGTDWYYRNGSNIHYQSRCTVIEPNSFINVIWGIYTDSPNSIKGSNLTIRSNFANCSDSVEFTVQLSDIKLN